jgi:hypothetical protein
MSRRKKPLFELTGLDHVSTREVRKVLIEHEDVIISKPHNEVEMYFTLHVHATMNARDADGSGLFKLVGEKVRFRVVKASTKWK